MALQDIIEQIAANLASVEGMGIVHQYLRWSSDLDKFLSLFKHTDADGVQRINGCMIDLVSSLQHKVTLGEKERAHVFLLRGYYSLRDEAASGIEYRQLLERAVNVFDADVTLGDTCLTTIPDWGPMSDSAGLQLMLVEPRMFGGVLCHYSECRLCAIERVED